MQVSSAMLFDMVAAGEEFTIKDVQWRHSSDSASERQRLFMMVFRWEMFWMTKIMPALCGSRAHVLVVL